VIKVAGGRVFVASLVQADATNVEALADAVGTARTFVGPIAHAVLILHGCLNNVIVQNCHQRRVRREDWPQLCNGDAEAVCQVANCYGLYRKFARCATVAMTSQLSISMAKPDHQRQLERKRRSTKLIN
jgi:hypothetical protein